MQPTISFLFRKSNPRYFSIEKVFANVMPILARQFRVQSWYAPAGRARVIDIIRNGMASRKLKSDIYHITGDVHYLAFFLPANRTVLTIHDCIFLKEKNTIKRTLLKWLFLEGPVRRVKYITTISEATKNDILKYTRCRPEQVIVIPNAVDPAFFATEKPFNDQQPLILMVGTSPNKNLERTASALHGIHCRLDIVGKLSEQQLVALKENNIQYTNSFNLDREALVKKYQDADIILFPTTFEGFGLPVLEAQQCGRPLITSNISPVADVAADGAYLVDPFDTASIRAGVLKIILDRNIREKLVANGFENIKKYSLGETASRYAALYYQVLKKNI